MKPSISPTGGKNGFVVWRPLNLRFGGNIRKTSIIIIIIIIIIMTVITTLRLTVIYKNLVLSNELIKVELPP